MGSPAAGAAPEGGRGEERQAQVRFTTQLPPAQRVPASSFAVPAHLTRYGLSEVINTLLGLDPPRPFDFLVEGELLRTSLEKLLVARKLSAEATVTIEYVPAVVPPEQQNTLVHPDWVSAVSGRLLSYIVSGSYDCLGRLWDRAGHCACTLAGHTDTITGIAYLSTSEREGVKCNDIVTSSKDHTLLLWQVAEKGAPDKVGAVKAFVGHSGSVQSVAASPSGEEICSGSWDCTIKLWQSRGHSEDPSTNDDVAAKKRRIKGGAAQEMNAPVEAGPQGTFEGHTQCVSAVTWPERESIYSASWDHSLRTWNTTTGANVATIETGRALHCLDVGGDSAALLAAGGADSTLRIWDPRVATGGPSGLAHGHQMASHFRMLALDMLKLNYTCCGCPWSEYQLLSASHDCTVRLWDTRSKVPLHTLDTHKDKSAPPCSLLDRDDPNPSTLRSPAVRGARLARRHGQPVLCADWWRGDSVVAGGCDGALGVALHILSALSPRDLALAAQVCRSWFYACSSQGLWQQLFQQRWGFRDLKPSSGLPHQESNWKAAYAKEARLQRFGRGTTISREGNYYILVSDGVIIRDFGAFPGCGEPSLAGLSAVAACAEVHHRQDSVPAHGASTQNSKCTWLASCADPYSCCDSMTASKLDRDTQSLGVPASPSCCSLGTSSEDVLASPVPVLSSRLVASLACPGLFERMLVFAGDLDAARRAAEVQA
eukprot:SM000002S05758  [mRNA]  locus=s2:2022853:2028350:+ [translate_table: standard]